MADPTPTAPAAEAEALPDRLFYSVMDPEHVLDGSPLPAATTLLHRVCQGDDSRFHEALRIVGLFVAAQAGQHAAALAQARADALREAAAVCEADRRYWVGRRALEYALGARCCRDAILALLPPTPRRPAKGVAHDRPC